MLYLKDKERVLKAVASIVNAEEPQEMDNEEPPIAEGKDRKEPPQGTAPGSGVANPYVDNWDNIDRVKNFDTGELYTDQEWAEIQRKITENPVLVMRAY